MNLFYDKIPGIGNPIAHYRVDVMEEEDLSYNDSGETGTGLTGNNTITVSSGTPFKKGMYIQLDTLAGEKNVITEIAGNVLTLENNLATDHTDVTVFFGCISSLTDLSGNGYHCLQMNAASQPKLIKNHINGRKAFYTDGTDDHLLRAFNLKQPYSIHGFVDMGKGAQNYVFDGYTSNWNYFRFSTNGVNLADIEMFAGTKISSDGFGLDNHRYFNTIFNGAQSYFKINDVEQMGNAGNVEPNGITLARINAPGVDFARGYFCEIIVYPKATTPTQNSAIVTQLKNYYGA